MKCALILGVCVVVAVQTDAAALNNAGIGNWGSWSSGLDGLYGSPGLGCPGLGCPGLGCPGLGSKSFELGGIPSHGSPSISLSGNTLSRSPCSNSLPLSFGNLLSQHGISSPITFGKTLQSSLVGKHYSAPIITYGGKTLSGPGLSSGSCISRTHPLRQTILSEPSFSTCPCGKISSSPLSLSSIKSIGSMSPLTVSSQPLASPCGSSPDQLYGWL